MLTHDLLDSLGSLVGLVEGDGGNKVVGNVGFNDTVEEVTADETEFTIDSCGSATGVGPGFRVVVGKRRVGVLKEGNSD